MKRIGLYLVLITAWSFLLSACGDDPVPSLQERVVHDQDEVQTFEGELQRPTDKPPYQKGTHQLQMADGELLMLQSPSINLSDYIGEAVRVEGELLVGVGAAQEVLTVSKIEYLNPEDELRWEAYSSADLGLSFEHPSTWILEERENEILLRFEEEDLLRIFVFSGSSDLDDFTQSRETSEPVEVTVGAQRSLRFSSGSNLTFYVANPAKQKIYSIEFTPSLVDDLETKKTLFLEILKSFDFIYMTQAQGQACGGEPPVNCPKDFICQYSDGSEFATGVCVPVGQPMDASLCPRLAEPSCDFRVANYNERGCPTRYQCIEERQTSTSDEPQNEGDESQALDVDELLPNYSIPLAAGVTQEYVNEKAGFSMRIPKDWYYASFGSVEGSVWTVGFLNESFEELDEALVTMTIQKENGGLISEKVGDLYYVFDGPGDLAPVMRTMAQSIKLIEISE